MQPISNNPGRNCPPRQVKPSQNPKSKNDLDNSGSNSGLNLPPNFLLDGSGDGSNGPTIINIFQLNQINQSQLFNFSGMGGTNSLGSNPFSASNPALTNPGNGSSPPSSGMPDFSQGLVGMLGMQSDPNGNLSNGNNNTVTPPPQNQFIVMPSNSGNPQIDPQTGQVLIPQNMNPQNGSQGVNNPQVINPQTGNPQNMGNIPNQGPMQPNPTDLQNQQLLQQQQLQQQLQQQQAASQADAQLEQQLTAICVMIIQLIQQMVMQLVGPDSNTQSSNGDDKNGDSGKTTDPNGSSGTPQVPWVDPDNNAFDNTDAIYNPNKTILHPTDDDDDDDDNNDDDHMTM